MESLWIKTSTRPAFKQLDSDTKTDVLIIGGGLCGILCAYMLEKAGVDYLLAEANEICSGITENTTAKITYQHGLIYDKLIRTFGVDGASLYLKANKEALDNYRSICSNIDCDFCERDSAIYSLNNRKKIKNEVAALNRLGIDARLVNELPLPFPLAGAVTVKEQGQFHPLKFAFSISKKLNIKEHTKVTELKANTAVTDKGTISAKNIIVATHFPILNKHGSYFLKLYQHRSYVIALKGAPDVNGIYLDEAQKGLSFRNYNDLLLLGGGSHRTGKSGGGWKELEDFASRYYPNAETVSRFATQDCMSLDGVPYIGRYSSRTADLFVATGFNKWGMTSSMVAATVLCDLVRGINNPYTALFSPSRSILHPQLALNAAESVLGLITPTAPRCPHMGCALKYNKEEHTWDCPCHGSRFSENGELIDNPATDDKK